MIKLQRVYDYDHHMSGFSILVDRLWPRGVAKKKLNPDKWFKEIAPSSDLRKWFSHDPDKWEEFRKRYTEELSQHKKLLTEMLELEKEHKGIILLYAAKDTKHTHAKVIKDILEEMKK